MQQSIISVQFNNQTLLATLVNDVPHVALKPICENLGIDWDSQRKRIERHPVLNSTTVMITAVAQDGKLREMLMMPIKFLNGWLFGIDASRVKTEAKETVIKYQRECFEVLANHFMPKRNGLVELPPKTLTPAMLRHINKRVAWLVKNQVGSSYSALGGAILDKFNVNKRENIPLEKYREVCELLNCEPDAKALQGELVEPLKIEYQPPEGMMLVAVEDFEKLKKSTQQVFPENYHQFIDVVNSMESANYRIFKKDVLVALHEMLSKMI